jgi:hypothetical protein
MWSAEERTMVDLIELNGYDLLTVAHTDYHIAQLFEPNSSRPITFRADTEYEALRKAFTFWSEGKKSKYA